MAKIQPIKDIIIKDQKDKKLNVFRQTTNIKTDISEDYKLIPEDTNRIIIASTGSLANSIVEKILELSKNISVYMVFKDFEKSMNVINQFDDKYTAIIREVPSLNNNFIILDDFATVYINSLSNDKNIPIELNDIQSKDLYYWFNYYFWNKSTKEKFLNEISKPKESPYPPFNLGKSNVKIVSDNSNYSDYNCLIIPRDIEYKKVIESNSFDEIYINESLETKVLYKRINNILQINDLWIRKIYYPKDLEEYVFDELSLNDLRYREPFIDFDSKTWDKFCSIDDKKTFVTVKLPSNSIDKMNDVKPKVFKDYKYALELEYPYEVLPPYRSKESKKSIIYTQFETLQNDYEDRLNECAKKISGVKSDSMIKKIRGYLQGFDKLNKNLKEISSINFKDVKYALITDEIEKLKSIETEVDKSIHNFNLSRKEFKAREKFNKEREKKKKELESKQKELDKIQSNKKENSIETKNEKKLKKSIMDLENKINEQFKFKDKTTADFSKKNSRSTKDLIIPNFALPDVGVLYETSDSYFLEIENISELERANELKNRYNDKKNYQVVAKRN